MTTINNVNTILRNEYGINNIEEGIEKYFIETTFYKKDGRLIDSIKKSARKSLRFKLSEIYKKRCDSIYFTNEREMMDEKLKARNIVGIEKRYQAEITGLLENCDYVTRKKYAEAVSKSRSLNFDSFERNLFVEIRMKKLWEYTNYQSIVEIADIIRGNFKAEDISCSDISAYRVTFSSFAELLSKGITLKQFEVLVKEIAYIDKRYKNVGMCISTNPHTYANGFQIGIWANSVIDGFNRSHASDFGRFIRVFKYTKFISPKLSHRQLKKLDGLNNCQLKMTVTDNRNWNRMFGFRLTTIVRKATDWKPIRKNHKIDAIWLSKFGRVPHDRVLWELPPKIINAFNKKSFGIFIKEYKQQVWGDHELLALAKLHVWFGKGYKSLIIETNSIHDLGIGLPEIPFEKGRKFLMRYKHRWNEAIRVVNNWEAVVANGIDPLSKEGLKSSLAFISAMLFDNVRDYEFAIECGKFITDQKLWEKLQDIWISREIRYESIPKIVYSQGDWKFYRLDRNDVRGPWLGEYTGCCQHPEGAGESCALHGTTDPDGSFVVLEHRGEIKFQSWVWRNGDTIVFDNVEGNCKTDLYEEAKMVYTKGLLAFKGKLGIKRVLVGTGLGDMKFDDMSKPKGCPVLKPNGYSDANQVWELEDE